MHLTVAHSTCSLTEMHACSKELIDLLSFKLTCTQSYPVEHTTTFKYPTEHTTQGCMVDSTVYTVHILCHGLIHYIQCILNPVPMQLEKFSVDQVAGLLLVFCVCAMSGNCIHIHMCIRIYLLLECIMSQSIFGLFDNMHPHKHKPRKSVLWRTMRRSMALHMLQQRLTSVTLKSLTLTDTLL